MTSRERVLATLNFKAPDRLPKDMGGMRSSGVSAFGYQALRNALGLPLKPTRVYDTAQMLALIHPDVLDALGCDVVVVEGDGLTNAFEQPGVWHPYDFNGRIPHAMVRDPGGYRTDAEGTIHLRDVGDMPRGAYVFNPEHAGQALILDGDLPRPNLREHRALLEKSAITDEQVRSLRDTCRRVRESTDRAVFLWGKLDLGVCIHGFGGLAVFPVLCLRSGTSWT
jgi:uroporphyrinogen decarboxylase